MKYLVIEHGQVFFTFDESGNNKKGIDLITKEDLLKLIQCALEDEHFEMDSYDDSIVHNAAHKVIYKNIYQKLDDLLKLLTMSEPTYIGRLSMPIPLSPENPFNCNAFEVEEHSNEYIDYWKRL